MCVFAVSLRISKRHVQISLNLWRISFLCCLPVAVARSDLLWGAVYTLCTSGFVDGVVIGADFYGQEKSAPMAVIFARNRPGIIDTTRALLIATRQGQHDLIV